MNHHTPSAVRVISALWRDFPQFHRDHPAQASGYVVAAEYVSDLLDQHPDRRIVHAFIADAASGLSRDPFPPPVVLGALAAYLRALALL